MSNINNKKSRRAVSPIVAVLILIVVAVVGGGAVAVLMGQIGSDTSKQASSQGTALKSSQSINIGGSTTVFPLTEAIKGNFTAKTGIQVNDAQGGSGAGMIGVDQGVLDIGAASTIKAYNDEVAKDPTANLQAFEIGGSAVVLGVHGAAVNGTLTADGTPGGAACSYFSAAILNTIYTNTVGPYETLTCSNGVVTSATPSASPSAASVEFFQRGDPGGTSETWTQWVQQSTANKDFHGGATTQATGNSGVLAGIVAPTAPAVQGAGGLDIGFVKTSGNGQVAIAGTYTVSSTSANPLVTKTGSIAPVESQILKALKGFGTNPANPQFPTDNTNGNTELARTFYYVTKGAPSASDQAFIDFARGSDPTVTDAFTALGYYPIYQYK